MTYDEAIAFWFGRINYEVRAAAPRDLKLERMRALLRLLGDPHERLRAVHVTGTKGKGSTSAMLAAVLRAAGYRVGLFTSPHLVRVEERIQIDGEPISAGELAALMAEVAPAVRALEGTPFPPPTFFEISTALAFLHFVRRRADVAVLEVGLGGRFDSTNVVRPLVSVITSVGLDHTAQLGNTLEEIAFQKAGIIKPRVPVVSGVAQAGPRAVIEHEAQAAGARVVQAGRDFRYRYITAGQGDTETRRQGPGADPLVSLSPCLLVSRQPSVEVTTARRWPPMPLGLLGEHQAANAAVAVATVELLRGAGLTIPDEAVARGLAEVRWPARVEVVSERPAIVLDSAHNVPSAEALVATLRQHFAGLPGRRAVVFAVSADKPYPEMLRVLAGYFDHFHLTRYGHNPRCAPPEKLAELLKAADPAKGATVHPTAADAWRAARSAAGPGDLVCVTGSVFLAGELADAVRG